MAHPDCDPGPKREAAGVCRPLFTCITNRQTTAMSDPTDVQAYIDRENRRRGRAPETEEDEAGDEGGDGPTTTATPTGGIRFRRDE